MLSLLYKACLAPLGIVVQTNDPLRLRQKLYALVRKTQDPSLDELAFVPSPTDPGQLWIINKGSIQSGAFQELPEGDSQPE